MDKKLLLVSFSGGETSGYMVWWLLNVWEDRHNWIIIVVFANTGQENEETLQFVHKCDKQFGLNVVWIEASVFFNERKGTGFKITNFKDASRDGEPFEEIIKKYGIPNMATPHCTRELKLNPINAYAKSIGWKDYHTAIGIRADEVDRVNSKYKERKLMYPLVQMRPMTKPKINFWWSQQSFRLELKGYQGNCVTCWKKSDNKLYQIAKENERAFVFMDRMEARYGKFTPESRLKLMASRGETPKFPVTFFRKNRSVVDIINESKGVFKPVIDDSKIIPSQFELYGQTDEDRDEMEERMMRGEDDSESCDVYSSCGD